MTSLRSPMSLTSRLTRGILALLIGTFAILALTAAPASADTTVSDAATALRQGASVFVAPDADPTITSSEADALRGRISAIQHPYFVAVLPASAMAGGDPVAILRQLRQEVGLEGTYALVVGKSFRAGDTTVQVSDLATAAFREHSSEGVFAVLDAFIASSALRMTGSSGEPKNPLPGILFFTAAAAALVGGLFYVSRKKKAAARVELAALRQVIDEDVTEFGEEAAAIDLNDPRLDDTGRVHAQHALDSYEGAKMSADAMAVPDDATMVTQALEDGRYSLACVKAQMAGQALPDRRPPCFVDPRHGPSAEDIMWAPDGGAQRAIPVCLACSTMLQNGQSPIPREVMANGQRVPYWRGGATYAPYAGGYYASSGADLMSMIFMGTMMGHMFGGGGMWAGGQGMGGQDNGGGFDGGGGGIFGGGGDFGGGGFGGGDFGGGGDF
ncbi:MAG: hypothetical protein WCI29_02220 [Actinomycetes bacterium]